MPREAQHPLRAGPWAVAVEQRAPEVPVAACGSLPQAPGTGTGRWRSAERVTGLELENGLETLGKASVLLPHPSRGDITNLKSRQES